MLTVLSVPHPASSEASSDASQPWNKVRAWFSRERGRAGRILQLALIGAARAASTSTNAVTPTPHRPTTFENAVWDSRPGMESRLRDTQLTMFDWINIQQSDEYRKMVDGALPPLPSETEVGSRTHAVKVCWGLPCKPRHNADNFPTRESLCHHSTASKMRAYVNLILSHLVSGRSRGSQYPPKKLTSPAQVVSRTRAATTRGL